MIYAVTGGTGSLARALIRLLLKTPGCEIRIVARNEHRLQETAALAPQRIKIVMGDVRDGGTLSRAFHGCHGVFHCAALKRIELAEDEPEQAILTNVMGTNAVCKAAIHHRVGRLLIVSSDKACNPATLYGATKAAAEHLAIAYNNQQLTTAIGCVRYGNVVASQGSVLTLWRDQMSAGQPVTLTQRGMTRFFITLPAAARFVLTAMRYLRGGEIFVPRMRSVRIERLAKWFCGRHPRQWIGLRSSEKIHEALISADEVRRTSDVGFAYIVWPMHPRTESIYGMPAKWTDEQRLFGYTSRNADPLSRREFDLMLKEDGNGRGTPSKAKTKA